MMIEMQILIDLILIQVVAICLIDFTDFPDAVTSHIHSWLTSGRNKEPFILKPIFCSVCMTWWIGLIWLIINDFTLFNLAVLALLTAFTPVVKDLIQTVYNILMKIIDLINRKLYE